MHDISTANPDKKKIGFGMILPNKTHIIVGLVLLLALSIEIGFVVSINNYIKNNNDNDIKKNMEDTNDKIISYLNFKIQDMSYIIRRNSAFFRINGIYLSSDNYTDFLQNIFSPQGNGPHYIWIPKISDKDIEDYETFCRKYITANCLIKQVKGNPNNRSDITFERANGRDYYYPLMFIEPKFPEPLQSILMGFDLNTLGNNFNIIKIANSSSEATATFRINLTPELRKNPHSYNFLLNIPSFIYLNSTDINKISGYSSVIIHIGDIFDEAAKNLDLSVGRDEIDFFAFDLTNDGYTNILANNISLLYKENKVEYNNIWFNRDIPVNEKSIFSYEYNISSRRWIILLKYSNDYIHNSRSDWLIIFPIIMPVIFVLLDLVIIVFYKFISSLKEKAVIEKKKANISTQMLGYVNHEIRNPLNVIKGLVQFTLQNMRQLDNEDANEINIDKSTFDTILSDLSTVAGSCNMLEHIVTDILDIRKLDSGKLELDNKWVKIDDFVKDISKTISQKIDEKQTIILKGIYDPTLILYFDVYRMKQILLNFLTNAVKYTAVGEITLGIEGGDNSFKFSVRDTGRGIHDEAKSKIFQPFNQTNPEDASRYGGIGLGLYLCKMLAERMDGTIGFESAFGKGSTFWVEFPKNIICPNHAHGSIDEVTVGK